MDSKNRDYTNGEITVFWRPAKCIHATTCYKELIEVFNPRNRPWVNMQGAPTERIIEVVNKCPTQALYYKWNKDIKEGGDTEVQEKKEEAKKTELKLMKDGPLIIKGNFKIFDEELKTMKLTSLCRCGHSKKMPYCDGTHRQVGFEAE